MDQKKAWEASTWDELRKLATLEEVTRALAAAEKQRVYHKSAYLKRAAILAKAKELGITGE